MARKSALQHFKSGKTYGLVLTAIVFISLLTWLVHPAQGESARSFVYLRNTLPVEQSSVIEAAPLLVSQVEPAIVEIDPDQELIERLQVDDTQIAYDKLEEQDSWHVVRMRVTGYCSCPKCCGKFSDGVTASNRRIRGGDVFVAADKHYKFGTEMIIPGYNRDRTVTVQDRGRVIKGNRLDLYFDTHGQAQKWGVKYLDVLVKDK